MKKTALFAIAAITLASCQPKQTSYQINGVAPDSAMNGHTVYLIDINKNEAVDSALIAENKFSFTGAVEKPLVRRIQLGRLAGDIILDNSTTAEVTLTRPCAVKDNGGYNDLFTQIVDEVNAGFMSARSLYEELLASGKDREEVAAIINQKYEEVYDIFRRAIAENKDNILGGHILQSTANILFENVASLDSAMNMVASSKDFEYLVKYRNSLANKENTSAGKMFVDFKGKDLKDNETALSNFVGKGKYVLADFWASWCGPCRAEIPNLIELEKRYGGDKFMVLGVNVWDNKVQFQEALKSQKINYAQIYASDNNDATELYGIQGIPQIILFAPDGTIVARDLRGAAMKDLVAEKMGK